MTKAERTKAHILSQTVQMIEEGRPINQLTVRAISLYSNVGISAINYHFGSKDNLLGEAAVWLLKNAVRENLVYLNNQYVSSQDKIKHFILSLAEVFYDHRPLTEIYLNSGFNKGRLDNTYFMIPVIKEAFPELEEHEARLIAFQLIVSLQYAFLHEKGFSDFMGTNYAEMESKDILRDIEIMIDNLLLTG